MQIASGRMVAELRAHGVRIAPALAAVVIFFGAAIAARAIASDPKVWGYALAALPALIVLQQAVYLVLAKPRFVAGDPEQIRGRVAADFHGELQDAIYTSQRFFDGPTIFLRYGIPALVLFLLGLIASCVLDGGAESLGLSDTTLAATRFGTVGAYVYVLWSLGRRGFRHDISTAAANWAVVTLAVGPVVAAVASKVWQASAGTPPPSSATMMAVYFLAGFSPRAVTEAIEAAGKRILGLAATPATERTIPLHRIRGMQPQVIERLAEEGIHDASSLAMADPVRLQRACNFDKRQVLNWIDEALLAHAMPEHFEKLQGAGVTGVVDLAWYREETREKTLSGLQKVASAIGMDAELLADAVHRLWGDAQVRLVSMLYQMETSDAD